MIHVKRTDTLEMPSNAPPEWLYPCYPSRPILLHKLGADVARNVIGYDWQYLNPSRTRDEPTIALSAKRSWAEIDAMLPILWHIRQTRPELRLLVLAQDPLLRDTQNRFPALMEIMQQTVDGLAFPRHDLTSGYKRRKVGSDGGRENVVTHTIRHWLTSTRLLGISRREFNNFQQQGVAGGSLVAMLRNHKPDTPVERRILRANPQARAISIHHGAHPVVRPEQRALPTAPGKGPYADVFLAKSEAESSLVSFQGTPEVVCVGTPKYDPAWLEHLTAMTAEGTERDAVRRFREQHGRCWLFLTRGPENSVMDPGDYDALLSALRTVAQQRPDLGLLVKPHPKEDFHRLRQALPGEEGKNWMFTGLPPYAAAQECDLAIAMWSSVILDAAAARIPVVELYRFRRPNRYLCLSDDGKLSSTHTASGLCRPASGPDDLEQLLGEWEVQGEIHAAWRAQGEVSRRVLGGVAGASLQKASNAVTTARTP